MIATRTFPDVTPITVQASGVIGVSRASPVESAALSMWDRAAVDWSILIANLGTALITEFQVQILFSLLPAPGTNAAAPEDWQPLPADDVIAAGVVAVDEYTLSFTVASFANVVAGLPASLGFTAPARGLNMKTLIWDVAGTPAGSDFTLTALRR